MKVLKNAALQIENAVLHPEKGLPDEVFVLISKLTPLINVDLLIKNPSGETLLTWREDPLCGSGWHIPGGIIRFQETISERIRKVAETELRSEVIAEPVPLSVSEFIIPGQSHRNHFISLLYQCHLKYLPPEKMYCHDFLSPATGEYAWFDHIPENLLKVHEKYSCYICN